MKYITGVVRVYCVCVCVFREVFGVEILKIIIIISQNAFLNAPVSGEGRAFPKKWGARIVFAARALRAGGSSRSGFPRLIKGPPPRYFLSI